MILLRPDCLAFERPDGESVPCSAEAVAIEVVGSPAEVEPELVRQAAAAVLHFFRADLGRTVVSVGEFSVALQKALRGLGVNVDLIGAMPADPETDLGLLAGHAGTGLELEFFPRLRDELRRMLHHSPGMIRFRGLRGCVKQLLGARRWSGRCQALNDQIVHYLRHCLNAEATASPCALVVR